MPTGRPPKPSGTKAVGTTIMLWPHEIESLENFRMAINRGMPARVSRSDLMRLAVSLLVAMPPEKAREELAARQQ